MQFQIRVRGIEQLVASLADYPEIAAPILQRALAASQAILAKYTNRDTVPWRTGFLTQSFRAELTAGVLRWFPTASYAPFVEFGTKPHIIVPREKKALWWEGLDHPVAWVNHPGTKANPFLERIIAASQSDIDETFASALDMIVKQISAI